jgi:hypothetical protein
MSERKANCAQKSLTKALAARDSMSMCLTQQHTSSQLSSRRGAVAEKGGPEREQVFFPYLPWTRQGFEIGNPIWQHLRLTITLKGI